MELSHFSPVDDQADGFREINMLQERSFVDSLWSFVSK